MAGIVPTFLDFETYYTDKASGAYSLSYMTNEEYIRDTRFETIGFSIARGMEDPVWMTGDDEYIRWQLNHIDFSNAYLIGHNMSEFDSLILSHHYGIRPKFYGCTLQMARRLHGGKVSNSLANLCKMYGIPEKGTAVHDAINKRRADFSPGQLKAYGDYCSNDVARCRDLFFKFRNKFPAAELQLMHLFTRMFADPRLELDLDLLKRMRSDLGKRKAYLLDKVADMLDIGVGLPHETRMQMVQRELRSDAKMAEILREEFCIEPPMKYSPKRKDSEGNPLLVYAFAKTDEAMQDMAEDDEDPDLQALIAARLGVKSTIAESRIERFVGIAERGPLAVPLLYGKTHTDRAAGGGKINLQNLTGVRSPTVLTPKNTLLSTPKGFDRLHKYNKKDNRIMLPDGTIYTNDQVHVAGMRDAIVAPKGKKIVVADSANIELRVCHLLARQMDTIAKIRSGVDLYCDLAEDIYGYPVDKKMHPRERQHGKVGHLQLQFQSGGGAFRRAARIMGGVKLTEGEAQATVDVYRRKHAEIRKFWRRCNDSILDMVNGRDEYLDDWGLIRIEHNRLVLPNGMGMEYYDLRQHQFEEDGDLVWVYDDKEKRRMKKVYGGAITENVTQALARIVVFEQMLEIEKRWGSNDNGVVLTVHDEVVAVVDEDDAEDCQQFMLQVMSQSPKWWPELPVKASGGIGDRYADAK
jgi:DNA polymerase